MKKRRKKTRGEKQNKKHTERYESDFNPVTSGPKSLAQSYLLPFSSSLLSTSRNGRAGWHRGFVPHGPFPMDSAGLDVKMCSVPRFSTGQPALSSVNSLTVYRGTPD